MAVIIFLLDNTPLMLQQSMMNGVRNSYIDIAKQTVEMFLELRESHPDRQYDRYMLLTYDIPPKNVKAGWNESMEQFKTALITLQCTGSTSDSNALGNVFELLNQERMMVGLDTYGYGRCPFNNMRSWIVLLTSHHRYPKVYNTQCLPLYPNLDGSRLTKEPFRWDQRLFALVLGSLKSSPYIEKMALAMGGWCMRITSKRTLDQSISRLAKSLNFELMVNFVQETTHITCIAQTSIIKLEPSNCAITYCGKEWKGSWPFPESYWPDLKQNELPPRDAHPEVRILPVCCDEPVWTMNIPVDKYEVRERMGGSSILLTADEDKVWPVVITTNTNRKEQPFGYLKRASGKTFLYVLPYNYPELHRLMDENFPLLNAKNLKFIYAMKHYISMIPPYYCFYLRKALSGMLENSVLETVLPDENVYYLNYNILKSLNNMRQDAKLHRMQLCDYVSGQQGKPNAKQLETAQLINVHALLHRRKEDTEQTVKNIVVPTTERSTSPPDYRKLHAIDRKDMLDMINRLRNVFYYPENMSSCMNSLKHTVPISQMQNYTTQPSVASLRTITDSDSTESFPVTSVRYNPQESNKRTTKRMKLL
ncbi:integrator complex subunit 6-like [Anopheles funestus]|uniref:integrator complex subunit 6-like n=1 Tax=Anopheles funestus TaxID=62324 RepID=UPI0020C6C600|nr:integrator complex subunit 6-like [Anopheles funestus]